MRAPAWALIAGAEVRMLSRSVPALAMGAVLPAALGLLIVWAEHDTGLAGRGTATGLQLAVLLALTTYTAGTTTLVARRSQSVLKRLRLSGASDTAVLTGVLLPSALLMLLQGAVMVVAGGGQLPGHAWAPIIAIAAGLLVAGVFAVVTSGWAPAPELAQLTTAPLALAFLGGAFWAARTPASEVEWWMLALPGVAVTQLTRLGWDEPGIGTAGGLAAAAALVIAAAVVAPLAVRAVRWDPRS
ncbi:ABC transporter permease [Actinoplanes sp. NPDC048791]|uniref:ABC transporter permease n=1 Tax=Actinoplanes sp. NPDC048791 TaxID=3154623 RepID=UPI0033E468D1